MKPARAGINDRAAGFRPLRHVRESWETSLRALETIVGIAVAGWWLWLLIALFVLWNSRRKRRPAPAPPTA